MSGNWGLVLRALLPWLQYMIGMVIAFVVIWLVGIRIVTKGRIIAAFHKNKRKSGGLFKVDQDHNCIWVRNKGDPKAERYNINPDNIEEVDWPGGFVPGWACVTLRSLEFVRYEKDSYNPEKYKGKVSAKSNRYLSDENVLGSVYRHAERSLGVGGTQKWSTMQLLVIGILMVGVLVGAYFSLQASNHAAQAAAAMQAIQRALGAQ